MASVAANNNEIIPWDQDPELKALYSAALAAYSAALAAYSAGKLLVLV
ncbi:hypothetical protein [Pseudoalteromonas sp. NBT06-2]|nr:hypothetical protein [Pseudoalteromonas sp. NBT06-2]